MYVVVIIKQSNKSKKEKNIEQIKKKLDKRLIKSIQNA